MYVYTCIYIYIYIYITFASAQRRAVPTQGAEWSSTAVSRTTAIFVLETSQHRIEDL